MRRRGYILLLSSAAFHFAGRAFAAEDHRRFPMVDAAAHRPGFRDADRTQEQLDVLEKAYADADASDAAAYRSNDAGSQLNEAAYDAYNLEASQQFRNAR
jgi:hypothetical protein